MRTKNCLWIMLLVLAAFATDSRACGGPDVDAAGKSRRPGCGPVPRRVMAFYYPWYGTEDGPGGAGRVVHWGRIDAAKKDISASTHYPQLGAYDSHDAGLLSEHCRWAEEHGIDTFIVSWWGHGSFSDRAMSRILDSCRRRGLSACIYYETVPGPRTAETAADDIVRVLNKYGGDTAYLKVNGRPVVFVYGRALQELGLADWLKVINLINEKYEGGVAAMGDMFGYGLVRVFDGVHTYNTAGMLRGKSPDDVRKWAGDTYRSWVQLADSAGKISTITVIPGYDDTKIRKPGLAVERYDSRLYRVQWEEAIEADPHWILITSFNEWHEGSEIEPSLEYGDKYIKITGEYAGRFKSKPRVIACKLTGGGLSAAERDRLRTKYQGIRIGVLPGADSMAFWWLLEMGIDVEVLTWEDAAGGKLTPQNYPVLLYCAGERYRRTVVRTGDVDEALVGYLRAGGTLAAMPVLPWPFYYDENGKAVNRSIEFGLTIRMGWENPPANTKLLFVQPKGRLPHVPSEFVFPAGGDLRWRPFFDGGHAGYEPLLQLRDGGGRPLGDAAAYAELKDGGRVAYCWFGMFAGPHAEGLLYDIFDFLAGRLGR